MSILKRKRFWGLLLTIGLLVYCFYDLDLYAILNAISDINIRYLIPLLFIEVIIAFIRATRFTYFVDAFKPAKIRVIFPIYCIGIMANLLMPYLTGQVARIFLLSKKAHVRKTSIFTTTVLEVLFDGLAIIGIFLVLSFFEVLPDEYHAWPVGDFELWNDLKRRGHEIMPHGYKHANLGEMPLEEAQHLVFKCIDMFNRELEGFKVSESVFNLPYNSSTPELEAWLFTKFRIIRTHGSAINPLPHKGMIRLGCTSFGPENIDNHLVESVDTFLEGPPGWFVYNTHGLDDEGWGPLSSGLLDELLDRWSGMENVDVLPVIPALDIAFDH